MRKLASVQKISNITEIPGADKIEAARVLGWNVVVGKGEFKVGDKVIYFEVDSFLQIGDERFTKFRYGSETSIIVNGETVNGHIVRSKKIRGVVSQGIVCSFEDLGFTRQFADEARIGDDLTDVLGILKWEEPVPDGDNIIGPFNTSFAPKTGAMRVQTLAPRWDEIVSLDWVPTVKVDGTSQTIINTENVLKIFGRNWELSHNTAGYKTAEEYGLTDFLKFNTDYAIQFELAGPGIQKNRLNLQKLRPFVFAVWHSGVRVPHSKWDQVLLDLSAPVLDDSWKPVGMLDEMVEKVSGLRGNITKDVLDEGIVYHLAEGVTAPTWMDRNEAFKIINNKFILKHNI